MRKPKPFFLGVLLIIIMIFVYLWQQNMSITLAYKLSSLQSDYNKLNSENDILRLKINSNLALEKMDKIAKKNNLLRPDEKHIIYID
jgi:cell division protein FtsL